jgi:hypothetical protein
MLARDKEEGKSFPVITFKVIILNSVNLLFFGNDPVPELTA